ncbi:hypothetical protein ABZ951_30735 [Streptomyces sp. NPDC046215]|uniref:hypothetical protein n=1 Tax=Streptomyces sp. NPDC046215 TaxID=3155774 RepID=UPI0033F96876
MDMRRAAFTVTADGSYAARLALDGATGGWFPERWTLDGPEPYAVPLPGSQPEEPDSEVLPLSDGRVLIRRRVAERHTLSLLYPTGPGTGELPVGSIECPRLTLLPPAPNGAVAYGLVHGERSTTLWLVVGAPFGPQRIVEVPGHCSGGAWLDRSGRLLALDRELEGRTKTVVVDLGRGGETSPLLQITEESNDRLLLADPDSGLLLVRSDAPGHERLGWGVLGSARPVRFPECLRLPNALLTPFAAQPGQELAPEGCAVALRIEGPTGSWVGVWRPATRQLQQFPAPAGWLVGTGLWTPGGELRLPYVTPYVRCGLARLRLPRPAAPEPSRESGRAAPGGGPTDAPPAQPREPTPGGLAAGQASGPAPEGAGGLAAGRAAEYLSRPAEYPQREGQGRTAGQTAEQGPTPGSADGRTDGRTAEYLSRTTEYPQREAQGRTPSQTAEQEPVPGGADSRTDGRTAEYPQGQNPRPASGQEQAPGHADDRIADRSVQYPREQTPGQAAGAAREQPTGRAPGYVPGPTLRQAPGAGPGQAPRPSQGHLTGPAPGQISGRTAAPPAEPVSVRVCAPVGGTEAAGAPPREPLRDAAADPQGQGPAPEHTAPPAAVPPQGLVTPPEVVPPPERDVPQGPVPPHGLITPPFPAAAPGDAAPVDPASHLSPLPPQGPTTVPSQGCGPAESHEVAAPPRPAPPAPVRECAAPPGSRPPHSLAAPPTPAPPPGPDTSEGGPHGLLGSPGAVPPRGRDVSPDAAPPPNPPDPVPPQEATAPPAPQGDTAPQGPGEPPPRDLFTAGVWTAVPPREHPGRPAPMMPGAWSASPWGVPGGPPQGPEPGSGTSRPVPLQQSPLGRSAQP